MKNTINNKIFSLGMAFMLILGIFAIIPDKAQAQYYDDGYGNYYDTSYDSGYYYDNGVGYYDSGYDFSYDYGISAGVSVGYDYGYSYGGYDYGYDYGCSTCYTNYPVYTPVAPVYTTPVYSYNNNVSIPPLSASCYATPLDARVGDTVTWSASVWGGTGSYNVSWTGTNGLSGNGYIITKSYNSSGTKNASITVMSGSQTISKNCDSSVDVREKYTYNNDHVYDYDYDNYSSLSLYCSANTNRVGQGDSVTWTAYPSGGNGRYTYSWSGSNNLSGSSRSVYKTYNSNGSKSASVTVYSDGRSISRSCDNNVDVVGYITNPTYVVTPKYVVNQQNVLDIGCYADPATIRVNQPSTWIAEVTGGIGPYKYSWTGTDGLTGTTNSVIKYYSTTGEKSAIVTITSADGKTGSRTCTNTLAVKGVASVGTGSTNTNTTIKNTTNTTNENGLSAAALFSLKNVPWGWVAILIILVLFATVMYLLFNRTKI